MKLNEIESVIETTKQVKNEKSDPDNVAAITTPGTRVAVLSNKADIMARWEPGWSSARVRTYKKQLQCQESKLKSTECSS